MSDNEHQKPTTDSYRTGWERIFGKKKLVCPACGDGGWMIVMSSNGTPKRILCNRCRTWVK